MTLRGRLDINIPDQELETWLREKAAREYRNISSIICQLLSEARAKEEVN